MTRELAETVVSLGAMTLEFARINRITYHPDGRTPESDADHTVMLGVTACALAARWYPMMDIGRVAQYALVHDLVEVYAGDTPTLRALDLDAKAAKAERERLALERITREFSQQLPWLANTIQSYEWLDTPEAQLVKALDKLLPKITHVLNDGATIRGQGVTWTELTDRYALQFDEIREYAAQFTELFELRKHLIQMVFEAMDGVAA